MARTKFSDLTDKEQAWLQAHLDALPAGGEFPVKPDWAHRAIPIVKKWRSSRTLRAWVDAAQ